MILYDEPSATYHANAATGSTDIRDFLRSPRLFKDKREGLAQGTTDALLFGIASHIALLEPKRYAEQVAIQPETYPGEDKKGKPVEKPWTYAANYCEAWRAEQRATGKVIVTQKQATDLFFMHQRMPAEVRRILETSRNEVTVRTKIGDLDVQCRVDCWDVPGRKKYDLKSIRAIEAIESQVFKLGYHIQDRWYSRVIAAETGEKPPGSRLVFCESQSPFRWKIVELDWDYQQLADKAIDDALAGISARMKSGCWEDNEDLHEIASPPAWASDGMGDEDDDEDGDFGDVSRAMVKEPLNDKPKELDW